jgi:hypothetical protein
LTEIYIPFFGENEPIQLIDLLPDESLALVALSRAIVRADGAITAEDPVMPRR